MEFEILYRIQEMHNAFLDPLMIRTWERRGNLAADSGGAALVPKDQKMRDIDAAFHGGLLSAGEPVY